MARPYIAAAHGAAGLVGCRVAAVGLKFPDGGGVSGTVAPWRDPTLLQRTGLLVWGGCRVAAVRRTGLLAGGGCMVF